jgi:glycine cleavage system H protein
MSDYPEDLKYSAEHEWVRSGNGNSVRIGITEYAADQLGDIVFVSLPEVGDTVEAGDACGSWSPPRVSLTFSVPCPA